MRYPVLIRCLCLLMLISSVKIQPDHMARGPELPGLPELRGDEDAAGGERLGRSAGEGPGTV